MARTQEEYEAAAMLLGWRFSKKSWTLYKTVRGVNSKGHQTQQLVFFHPDTLKELTRAELDRRKFNIQAGEDPDAILWWEGKQV